MASKHCFFPDDLGPKKATKAILHQFWKKFGYRGNKSPVSRLPHAKTIKRLIEIIEMVAIIYPSATRKTIAARRLSFDKTKARTHPFNMHPRCFACPNPADLRHHIIPIKHRGTNERHNLISLCQSCHKLVHPWLNIPLAITPKKV